MKTDWQRRGRLALLGAALGLMGLVARQATAQGPGSGIVTFPGWMVEADISGAAGNFLQSDGMTPFPQPLFNRYLTLWTYEGSSEDSKYSIWTAAGDPLNANDDFGYVFSFANMTISVVSPFGPRVWCSSRGTNDDRPYGNIVTVRVDDSTATGGFRDITFPSGGSAVYAPSRPDLPAGQGYFQPYRFESNTLEINQKLQFARDLIRVEYEISNFGGAARRVGVRSLLNPFNEDASVFLPESRERIFYETDFGTATGTGVTPPRRPDRPAIPSEILVYGPTFFGTAEPNIVAKAILRGNGATTPTRVVVGNSLNMYPTDGQWDYSVTFRQELRISDIGILCYYDPIVIPAGQRRSIVAYIGMGVASHAMSNAYLAGQLLKDNLRTQGYIGAVQTAEAVPLINGHADVTDPNDATSATGLAVDAYMQNEYHLSSIANPFAFIDLPDGLQFISTNAGQNQRLDLASLSPVGQGTDESTNRWTLQANGVEAGLLPINVFFNNAFDDATRVTRLINVPQGTRFQLGPGRTWRFLTMPFTYDGNLSDPAVALGLAAGTFQVVRYNPSINQYEQVSQLVAGQSYWVRSLNLADGETAFIRLQNAVPIKLSNSETFVSKMQRGWNMVANPTPYAVPVNELQVLASGGLLIPFSEAVANGFIRGSLFQYNRKLNRYEELTRDSVVQPGRGVWLFSNGERGIVFPAPFGRGISITP